MYCCALCDVLSVVLCAVLCAVVMFAHGTARARSGCNARCTGSARGAVRCAAMSALFVDACDAVQFSTHAAAHCSLWCDNVRALYGARAVCYTLW
jgi:hypothetical protein